MKRMRLLLIFVIMMVIGSIGYGGTYEKDIYVDMTILWGGTLPEAVYILPDYNDDAGIQLQKWEDGIWKPLANSGLYSDSNRNNGIEPSYTAGLKLTDDNFDGIYTGKVKYIGNDGKRVNTRLYIRKNDMFNTLHTPYYERKSGVTGASEVTSTWRPIVGNGDAIKWSWEDKWVSPNDGSRPVEYKTSHIIYKGLSSDLGIVNVPYTNADTVLRRDVANNIAWSSSDANIAYIEKIYDNIGTAQYVKSVRIIGKNTGTATITIKFGLNNSTTNGNLVYHGTKTIAVTVQDYNPVVPFQTVILNAASDITSNDIISIDNNSSFYTGTVPMAATFAPDTRDSALANPYNFATTTYMSFATPVGGEGYLWWVPSVVRTGAVLHLTRWNSTGTAPKDLEVAIWKNKDPAQEIKSTLKIPSPVGGMSANISSSAKKFYWNENTTNYSDYTKRDVIVRVSKVGTDLDSVKYNPYNLKNPIVRADDATVVDSAKMATFDKDTGLNYLDYVFSGANTLISVDGRMVKSDMYSSGERTITISKFPVGKYRIQLYTLRSNLNSSAVSGIRNYSVLTFEGEDIFEVTSKDYDEDNTVEEDTYYINKINPYNFPNIQTYIMTRSKYLINPSVDSIFYNGISGKVGERMEDSSGADGFSAVGMAGSNTTVTADTTYQSVKPQMDIVLCLDRSSSMSTRMAVVKETWKKFEANMSKRGYDVKYQMISFGGTATSWWYEPNGGQVIHNGWVRSLVDNSAMSSPTTYETAYTNNDKFTTTTNEGAYEPSNQALYKATDILNNYGRTIGEKKSKRYIIFFTDEGGLESGIDVDHQEKYIRGSGVTLIGLGQVYINDAVTKAQMFDDDSGEPVSGGSGRYYYDLRILLGDIFNWYQITDNSENMLKKLERGMVNAGYTTFWRIEHKTPYPLEDYTKRSVEFEVRESTITGAVGATAMKYGGIAEERVYRAPKLFITGVIDTPQPNDAFQINPIDTTKYMINGKMWGELTFEDMSIPMAYADLSQIDLRVFEYKSLNSPSNYDNADAVIIDGAAEKVISKTGAQLSKSVTDGSYGFSFNVEELKLRNTGFDSFFVKVTAKSTNSGMEGSIGQHNVKLDSDPPKIIDIKMVNKTARDAMLAMKSSESTDNAFNMDLEILNTLWYKPYDETMFQSDNSQLVEPKFVNRESKHSYDGRFVKDKDVIEITATMIDQNFDITQIYTDDTLGLTLTNMGISGDIKPTEVSSTTITLANGETGVKVIAKWNITVSNTNTTDDTKLTAIMKIKAIDKYGNSTLDTGKSTNVIGDIEIAKIDNINPGYAEWESGKAVTNSAKADLIPFTSKAAGAVITKEPYQLNCYGGAGTVDANGIRAFKVYYTYDSTQSDWGSAGESTTGNHDADMHGSSNIGYFYIKAGNAVNLSWNGVNETQLPASGFGVKIPNTVTSGDDGKYVFKVTAVDKAGNETYYSSTIKEFNVGRIEDNTGVIPKIVYVDTQAPEIDSSKIILKKYSVSGEVNNDNIVKNGDRVHIYSELRDFSAVTSDIIGVATIAQRYYNAGSYPKYSGIIGNGIGTENPVFAIPGATIELSDNRTKFVLKIGEVSSGNDPYIVVEGRANEEYNTGLIVGAKDLAGNEAIAAITVPAGAVKKDGTIPLVDNIKPTTPIIKAYAEESGFRTGVESFYTDTADSVKNIDRDETKTHFSKHRDNYWIKNSAVVDSDVERVYFSANGGIPTYISKIIYSNSLYNGFYKITDVIENRVNSISMMLEDTAGNKSDSASDQIVIDRLVPNGAAKNIFQGPVAVSQGGNSYRFEIEIKEIPDFVGLQKMEITLAGGVVTKTITPTYDPVINAPQTTAVERKLSGSVILDVPTPKIGSYVDLKVKLFDNLGNHSTVTHRSLVPNVNVNIWSQQRGSDKEIRTKIDVIDAGGKVDLQKVEETGKNAPKKRQE
jgi:hypothetical protein